jgi:formylglycine-generating enzyme required for sulfatase activity
MVALPGGSFVMGSNTDRTEQPRHAASVRSFAIGKYEVTEAEWAACAGDGGCSYKPAQPGGAPGRRPISNLSWDDATQYIQWLQRVTGRAYRMPTEAEWEYAARAGTTTRYPWGDRMEAGKVDCNGCGGTFDRRHVPTTGDWPPNQWGLHDMLGGVAEWVEDCWHSSYQGAPADGSPWYGAACQAHVLRGGSRQNSPPDVTPSARNFYDTGVRYPANGMRVALTLP